MGTGGAAGERGLGKRLGKWWERGAAGETVGVGGMEMLDGDWAWRGWGAWGGAGVGREGLGCVGRGAGRRGLGKGFFFIFFLNLLFLKIFLS